MTRPLAAVVTPSYSPIGASLSQLRLYPVFAIRGLVEGEKRFSVRFGRGLRHWGTDGAVAIGVGTGVAVGGGVKVGTGVAVAADGASAKAGAPVVADGFS